MVLWPAAAAASLLAAGGPIADVGRPVATYSIVARDPETGEVGVAVQSHWFSVGSVVPWAEAGVGARGQSLQQHSGVLVEPAKAFFRVEQRMVFDVQIPQALQLFAATEGRKPNSHDEFMTKIIAANQIQLPRLPPGQKYIYSPEKGELMVERPAK